jgi:hypothetical protein
VFPNFTTHNQILTASLGTERSTDNKRRPISTLFDTTAPMEDLENIAAPNRSSQFSVSEPRGGQSEPSTKESFEPPRDVVRESQIAIQLKQLRIEQQEATGEEARQQGHPELAASMFGLNRTSMLAPPNQPLAPPAACPMAVKRVAAVPGPTKAAVDSSDDELEDIERDEFKRVQESQGVLKRIFGIKPQCRTICFDCPATEAYEHTMDLWRKWKRFGLVLLQDDRKGMVMRCKLPALDGKSPPPFLRIYWILTFAIAVKTKMTQVVFEIRSAAGNRRIGPSIARITMEKGNIQSFSYLYQEMYKDYDPKILTQKSHAIRRMNKVFL